MRNANRTTRARQRVPTAEIPRRPFRPSGVPVSLLGLGGSSVGGVRSEAEAIRLVHEVLDAGITFLENAWEYHDGRSEKWMGKMLKARRNEAFIMTKVCTHGRDGKLAMRQLEESLRRLQTDVIDLWQIHEVTYENDPVLHFAKGGAVEALDRAKRQGKVRFVNLTKHKDPAIHFARLRSAWTAAGSRATRFSVAGKVSA